MNQVGRILTGLRHICLYFTEKTRLDKNFEFTSLSFIQLICGLEDEFDIDIPNSAVKKIKTVGDVVKFLEKNI